MRSELKITWDGATPGLAEHRLSLAAFGRPLDLLLASLRRIATQMVSTAIDTEHPKTGRFANIARQLDIEIESLVEGSGGFNGLVTFAQPPEELPLFMDLPERATGELLDSIEQESKGVARNWAVRRYLSSLPRDVTTQVYELHENGTSKKRVTVSAISLTEIPSELPSLIEYEGSVVGVGFSPGRSEVRIKSELSSPSLDAADTQVEAALQMRKANVRVLGVHDGKRARLLSIANASAPRFKVTPEAVEKHIFERWKGVFARLAK